MPRIASVLLVAALFFTWFASDSRGGQSLGELARKERERRDENKAQGVAVREFAAGEIFEQEEDADAEEGEDGADAVEGDNSSTPDDPEGATRRSSIGLDAALDDPESAEREDESRDRSRREADFRARYQTAKQRVTDAQKHKQFLDGLHLVGGVQYVDENGNTVIESLDHLRRLIREAEQDQQAAFDAVKALEEEAHRQSYPKGWLR